MTRILSTADFPDSVFVHTRVHGVPLQIRVPLRALTEAPSTESTFAEVVTAVNDRLELIQEAAFAQYSVTRQAQVELQPADLDPPVLLSQPPLHSRPATLPEL